MKSAILIFVSLFLLCNNILFTYSDFLFEKAESHICTMDEEQSCCVMSKDECCGMDECCMNIPVPSHFSFGVIVGSVLTDNKLLHEAPASGIQYNTHSTSVLSEGFLFKLYKPPAV